MPVIGFYSKSDFDIQTKQELFSRWVSTSILLLIVWNLMWKISNINAQYKYRWYLILAATLIGIIYGLGYLSNNDLQIHPGVRFIFAMLLFYIIQYALKSQQNISGLKFEKEQLLTENYKSQLKALRTQIDPHFLFNSLNTLRSMIRQQHSNSEKFVMSLSDFYRQTLKHNENTTLPLSEELDVLKSYLFLMRNRNEEAISTKINIEDALFSFHLPTLATQVVVENCFKHNMMTSKMPLHIEVKNTLDHYIEISNNIQPKITDNETTGYGLDLLKKRYELMNIPQGVIIKETPDQFIVQLKLIKK